MSLSPAVHLLRVPGMCLIASPTCLRHGRPMRCSDPPEHAVASACRCLRPRVSTPRQGGSCVRRFLRWSSDWSLPACRTHLRLPAAGIWACLRQEPGRVPLHQATVVPVARVSAFALFDQLPGCPLLSSITAIALLQRGRDYTACFRSSRVPRGSVLRRPRWPLAEVSSCTAQHCSSVSSTNQSSSSPCPISTRFPRSAITLSSRALWRSSQRRVCCRVVTCPARSVARCRPGLNMPSRQHVELVVVSGGAPFTRAGDGLIASPTCLRTAGWMRCSDPPEHVLASARRCLRRRASTLRQGCSCVRRSSGCFSDWSVPACRTHLRLPAAGIWACLRARTWACTGSSSDRRSGCPRVRVRAVRPASPVPSAVIDHCDGFLQRGRDYTACAFGRDAVLEPRCCGDPDGDG